MKKLKIVGMVAVLLLLVSLVGTIQAGDKVPVSRYVGTYVSEYYLSEYNSSHVIELKPDGTFVALINGKESHRGTYEIKRGETFEIEGKTYEAIGDVVIFHGPDGSARYSIKDKYFGVEPDRWIKQGIPTGEEKGIPGFEAVFAVAGLLAVGYILRRRNK